MLNAVLNYRYTWIVMTIVASLFIVHNQSLWLDECISAHFGQSGSLSELWTALRDDLRSDVMQPLYVLYTWCWMKIFGSSEWLLRASNVPFLFLMAYLFRRHPLVLAVVLISPFVFYYFGEFRPYASITAVSVWMVFLLLHPSMQRPDGTIRLNSFYASIWVMCALSMVTAVWAVGAIVAMLMLMWDRGAIKSPEFLKTTLKWCIPFCLLGGYYVYLLLQNLGVSPYGISCVFDVAQSCYEVTGFSGFGPGRLEARSNILRGLDYLFVLIPAAIVIIGVLVAAWRVWRRSVPKVNMWAVVVAVVLPLILLCILHMMHNFRFSGRHCAPLFAYYIYVLGYWIRKAKWKKRKIIAYILLCLCFAYSCVQLRFAQRFAREDYRGVAAYIEESAHYSQKKIYVWGNVRAFQFYKVPAQHLLKHETNLDNLAWDEIIIAERSKQDASYQWSLVRTSLPLYSMSEFRDGFCIIRHNSPRQGAIDPIK